MMPGETLFPPAKGILLPCPVLLSKDPVGEAHQDGKDIPWVHLGLFLGQRNKDKKIRTIGRTLALHTVNSNLMPDTPQGSLSTASCVPRTSQKEVKSGIFYL